MTKPYKKEKVPVLAADGHTPLGYCEVRKFRREKGEPLKVILISDADDKEVATILVHIKHSRVVCGPLEELAAPVDSSDAAAVARAALGQKGKPRRMLTAIQNAAAELAGQPLP